MPCPPRGGRGDAAGLMLGSASGSAGGRGPLLAPPAWTRGAEMLLPTRAALQAACTPGGAAAPGALVPDKATQPLPLAVPPAARTPPWRHRGRRVHELPSRRPGSPSPQGRGGDPPTAARAGAGGQTAFPAQPGDKAAPGRWEPSGGGGGGAGRGLRSSWAAGALNPAPNLALAAARWGPEVAGSPPTGGVPPGAGSPPATSGRAGGRFRARGVGATGGPCPTGGSQVRWLV